MAGRPVAVNNQLLVQQHRSSCAVACCSVLLLVRSMVEHRLQLSDTRQLGISTIVVCGIADMLHVWFVVPSMAVLPHVSGDSATVKMHCAVQACLLGACSLSEMAPCAHGKVSLIAAVVRHVCCAMCFKVT
jgi:hypothetical protein